MWNQLRKHFFCDVSMCRSWFLYHSGIPGCVCVSCGANKLYIQPSGILHFFTAGSRRRFRFVACQVRDHSKLSTYWCYSAQCFILRFRSVFENGRHASHLLHICQNGRPFLETCLWLVFVHFGCVSIKVANNSRAIVRNLLYLPNSTFEPSSYTDSIVIWDSLIFWYCVLFFEVPYPVLLLLLLLFFTLWFCINRCICNINVQAYICSYYAKQYLPDSFGHFGAWNQSAHKKNAVRTFCFKFEICSTESDDQIKWVYRHSLENHISSYNCS